MLESLKPKGGKRWPRGQKFELSPTGVLAEASYRAAVQLARAQGRNALEVEERRWAEPLGVQPHDGVVLGELRGGRKSLSDLTRGLEDCGSSAADVKAAIDRLAEAQLVAAVPASAAEAA